MLDQLPIGEPEPKYPLKCLCCDFSFEEGDDYDNLDETGHCIDCWEETNGLKQD